jgi:hypothetical protein
MTRVGVCRRGLRRAIERNGGTGQVHVADIQRTGRAQKERGPGFVGTQPRTVSRPSCDARHHPCQWDAFCVLIQWYSVGCYIVTSGAVKVCGDAGVKTLETRYEDAGGQDVRRRRCEGVKTLETRYEDAGGQGVRRRRCEGVKTRATRYEDADGQGVQRRRCVGVKTRVTRRADADEQGMKTRAVKVCRDAGVKV